MGFDSELSGSSFELGAQRCGCTLIEWNVLPRRTITELVERMEYRGAGSLSKKIRNRSLRYPGLTTSLTGVGCGVRTRFGTLVIVDC